MLKRSPSVTMCIIKMIVFMWDIQKNESCWPLNPSWIGSVGGGICTCHGHYCSIWTTSRYNSKNVIAAGYFLSLLKTKEEHGYYIVKHLPTNKDFWSAIFGRSRWPLPRTLSWHTHKSLETQFLKNSIPCLTYIFMAAISASLFLPQRKVTILAFEKNV